MTVGSRYEGIVFSTWDNNSTIIASIGSFSLKFRIQNEALHHSDIQIFFVTLEHFLVTVTILFGISLYQID